MLMIRNLKTGLLNFWKWRKVIFNDRPWDFAFFLKLVEKKLELMIKEWKDNDVYVDQDSDMHSMMKCRDALQRLIKDDYCFISDDWHEVEKFRKIDTDIFFYTLKSDLYKWWS